MTVYLDKKRTQRAEIAGKVQHLIAGFPLLFLGIDKLREGAEIPMATLEVMIAAIVLITFAISSRIRSTQRASRGRAQSFQGRLVRSRSGRPIDLRGIPRRTHQARLSAPAVLSGMATLALGRGISTDLRQAAHDLAARAA